MPKQCADEWHRFFALKENSKPVWRRNTAIRILLFELRDMFELELQQYPLREYPQENARCEWKEFKNLKNSFCGDEKDDVISYVSAIANMEGGYLVIGMHDKTLEIVGTDTYN